MAHRTVQCPQCLGDGDYCLCCEGTGRVTYEVAHSWYRANDDTHEQRCGDCASGK